jgi:hypothetical protein
MGMVGRKAAGSSPRRQRAGDEGDEGESQKKCRLSGAQGEMERWTSIDVDGGNEGGSRKEGEYRKPFDDVGTDQERDRHVKYLKEH